MERHGVRQGHVSASFHAFVCGRVEAVEDPCRAPAQAEAFDQVGCGCTGRMRTRGKSWRGVDTRTVGAGDSIGHTVGVLLATWLKLSLEYLS